MTETLSVSAPTPAGLLREQAEAFARSVGRMDESAASPPRVVADLVGVGLGLYESTRESVRRWHADLQERGAEVDVREAEEYMDVYRILDRAFDGVAAVLGAVAGRGWRVDDGDRFTRQRMGLKAMLTVTAAEAAAAAGQAESGRCRPAAEVRDAVRRRLQ